MGYLWLTLSHEVEQQMPPELNLDLIGALTGFSVGTLDGRDAMMVIEIAANAEDFAQGIRHKMPVAMTPERARELCERRPATACKCSPATEYDEARRAAAPGLAARRRFAPVDACR